MKWRTHIIFAGNEFPVLWKDTADSIGRRFLMYYFVTKVRGKNVITDLHDKLMQELPLIMLKCVRAYHEMVNEHSAAGIWSFCPKYFLETREQLKKDTNTFHAFMMDTANIVISPTLMVSDIDLIREFKEYLKATGKTSSLQSTGKTQAFQSIVQELNDIHDAAIEYRSVAEQSYCGEIYYGQSFFFGIGLTSRLTDVQKQRFFHTAENDTALTPAPDAPAITKLKAQITPALTPTGPKGKEEEEDDEDW